MKELALILFFINNPSFEVFIKSNNASLGEYLTSKSTIHKGFSSPISEVMLVLKIC
jgi:hypothetical protein